MSVCRASRVCYPLAFVLGAGSLARGAGAEARVVVSGGGEARIESGRARMSVSSRVFSAGARGARPSGGRPLLATLRLGSGAWRGVAGRLRVHTLGGWASGLASEPDVRVSPGGRWVSRPSLSGSALEGAVGEARVGSVGATLGLVRAGSGGNIPLLGVGARGHGAIWEALVLGLSHPEGTAAVGVRRSRTTFVVSVRVSHEPAAWRMWISRRVAFGRVEIGWERALGVARAPEGDRVLGQPRSGWTARARWRGGGVTYGTRADDRGSGLWAWRDGRSGPMSWRLGVRVPRASAANARLDAAMTLPGTGVRLGARMSARLESSIGPLAGLSARGAVLGIVVSARVEHASTAPAWTAVYIGGGEVRPIFLRDGDRMHALELARGALVARVFEVSTSARARAHAGASLEVRLGGGAR